jgi:AAA ATPase domain
VVGRERELDALRALLEARGQLPVTAVLKGDPGIGKTTLLGAAAAVARAEGYRLLDTRPSEAEAVHSFVGLADLLGDVEETVDELPGPQRRALEAALLLADPDRPVDERVIGVAFLGALRALARRGPLVVAVDDLQWLDEPTLACLRFAPPASKPSLSRRSSPCAAQCRSGCGEPSLRSVCERSRSAG